MYLVLQKPFCIEEKPRSRQAVNLGSYLEEEIGAWKLTAWQQAATLWDEEL